MGTLSVTMTSSLFGINGITASKVMHKVRVAIVKEIASKSA